MLVERTSRGRYHRPEWIKVYVSADQWRRLNTLADGFDDATTLRQEDAAPGGTYEPFAVLNDDLTVRVLNVLFPGNDYFKMTPEEEDESRRLGETMSRIWDGARRRSKARQAAEEKRGARYLAKQERAAAKEAAAKKAKK